MPRVPILPPEKASTEAKKVYDEFYQRMSFSAPPNFITTQGHSPSVARGTWEAVKNILVLGEIPRWTKEMIFVAISIDRGCGYCTAAHSACCRMLGVEPDTLRHLVRDVNNIGDPKTRDMILFAIKCAKNPQGLLDSDMAKLYGHGLTTSQVVELIAMSAFAVYANIIADATAMDPDDMFSKI
jgi:uncharacterized peroxidase-related enzyme